VEEAQRGEDEGRSSCGSPTCLKLFELNVFAGKPMLMAADCRLVKVLVKPSFLASLRHHSGPVRGGGVLFRGHFTLRVRVFFLTFSCLRLLQWDEIPCTGEAVLDPREGSSGHPSSSARLSGAASSSSSF